MQTEKLLTVSDFAARWDHRSPRTVRKYCQLGWLTFVRIGKRSMKIPESELARLMVTVTGIMPGTNNTGHVPDFKCQAAGDRDED